MRLNAVGVSQELRQKAAAYAFTSFTLTEIPTGRDPRRLQTTDDLPMLMIHVNATATAPHGIGGSSKAWHAICLYFAFHFEDGDDLNLLKLAAGQDIVEFIFDNQAGTTYTALVSDAEGTTEGWPTVDYNPVEERQYEGSNIALIKVEVAVRQVPTFRV